MAKSLGNDPELKTAYKPTIEKDLENHLVQKLEQEEIKIQIMISNGTYLIILLSTHTSRARSEKFVMELQNLKAFR